MKQLTFFIFLLAFLLSTRSPAQTANPDYVDGVIYMKVYDSSSVQPSYTNPSAALAQLISDYSITNIERAFKLPDLPVQKIYRMTFSDYSAADNLVAACQAMPYVEYAEKAPLYEVNFQPNDYSSNTQWYLQKINAPAAWNTTTGSPTIKIAIIDNAVNYSHVDLLPNAWVNPGEIAGNGVDDDSNGFVDDVRGYDVSDNDNNPKPPTLLNSSPFIHGTHCAGIASAATNNGIGVSSIAFQAKIISVKCTPDTATGSRIRNGYEGLDYAISADADVVSMSFGSTQSSFTWQVLINAAAVRNIVIFAAAGNNNSSTPYYPAANINVIAVGATDNNDVKSSFSNYGAWVDIMAPGSNIYNTLPQGNNTYGSLSGTSMACPLAAGLAGLVLALNPNFTALQVENFIKAGCQNINAQNPNYIGQMGTGRIDAQQTMVLITGVEEAESIKPFVIYPNPSDGNVFIQPNEMMEAPVQLEIYDASGRIVMSRTLSGMDPGGRMLLPLNELLAPGNYSLILTLNNEMIETEMLIITRAE